MPSVYEIVTQKIITQLESVNVSDYKKSWFNIGTTPRNVISDKCYRGINVFLLAGQGNNFASYKQWQEKKCQVKKGEKSSLVTFWSPFNKIDSTGKEKKSFILRYYNVFSADQVEGDFAEEVKTHGKNLLQHEKIEQSEKIVTDYLTAQAVKLVNGDRACYAPSKDRIEIPHIGQFESAEQYYNVLFHEMTHSTGHESRMKRDLAKGFGSQAYAKEELIAELGAAMLCAKTEINQSPRADHAAYIKSWLQCLKGDSKYVIQAASAAQKACDLILGISYDKPDEETATT